MLRGYRSHFDPFSHRRLYSGFRTWVKHLLDSGAAETEAQVVLRIRQKCYLGQLTEGYYRGFRGECDFAVKHPGANFI